MTEPKDENHLSYLAGSNLVTTNFPGKDVVCLLMAVANEPFKN